VRDGVCGLFIADKLGVSQPTASEHLRILVHAGLVRPTRIKQWTFYRRDEARIAAVKREFKSAGSEIEAEMRADDVCGFLD